MSLSYEKIENLGNLKCVGNEIRLHNVKGLKDLGNLESVNGFCIINGCNDLQSLGNIKKLKYLYLSDNKNLKSLGDLEAFKNGVILGHNPNLEDSKLHRFVGEFFKFIPKSN